jgi:hypothetical protein
MYSPLHSSHLLCSCFTSSFVSFFLRTFASLTFYNNNYSSWSKYFKPLRWTCFIWQFDLFKLQLIISITENRSFIGMISWQGGGEE